MLTIFRTPNQQEEDQKMKGKNAEQIFKNLQQKYVDNCLSKNVEGSIIKVHAYEPTQNDIDLGLIDIDTKELAAYYDLFQIEHKEMHILEKIGSFDGFLVVKCMETFINEDLGKDKQLIRTLRIYDLDNNYQLLDSILLEQIKAYSYNPQMQRAHTSVLQNGHVIYFFRRIVDSEAKTVMQMYSYNMIEKKSQMMEERHHTYFDKHKSAREKQPILSKLKGYCFEEKDNHPQFVSFSQEIGNINHESDCDHSFLANFFIIK